MQEAITSNLQRKWLKVRSNGDLFLEGEHYIGVSTL